MHLCLRQKLPFPDPVAELGWETLDQGRLAAVFPDGQLLRLQALPSGPSGLGAQTVRGRAESLEALRQIMCAWSTVPKNILNASSLAFHPSEQYIARMESEMARYYTQEFWELAGRPPILPHHFPSESL